MKVIITKIHEAWNYLYDNEFTINDVLDLEGDSITAKSGRKYSLSHLCMSFSNHCSYEDIVKKQK